MARRVFGIATLLVIAVVAVGGAAANLEVGLGTGPSVSLALSWDLSSNLVLGTSFVMSFGPGLGQAGLATLQTPSYTAGIFARFQFRSRVSPISPYVGAGAQLGFHYGRDISTMLTFMSGVRVDVTPNLYILGEGTLIIQIADIVSLRWRIWLKAGLVFPF
jgi:hypothetical protein